MAWRADRATAGPPDGTGDGSDDGAALARFERLYDSHYADLLRYVVRRIDQPDHAADVVAETFLTAWRRVEDIPPGPEARPWLFGVARRAMANQRRGTRRRTALVDRLGAELATVRVARPAVSDVTLSALGGVFRALSDTDREVLSLVAWEALSAEEIAVALGCSRTAARIRLHRARRRFAGALAAAGIDVEPHLRPVADGTTGRTTGRGPGQ